MQVSLKLTCLPNEVFYIFHYITLGTIFFVTLLILITLG